MSRLRNGAERASWSRLSSSSSAAEARRVPRIVQRDCVAWAEEVVAALPTIVVVVRAPRGREIADADVRIDGKRIALDGRAVRLDPGEHRLVARAGGERAERRLLLREGERMRRVVITLGRPEPEPEPPGFEPHAVAWVLTAAASLATAGFVTLAVVGKTREAELERCAPVCELDDVKVMRQLYLGADISLGIAIAAAVALGSYFAVDTQLTQSSSTPWVVRF